MDRQRLTRRDVLTLGLSAVVGAAGSASIGGFQPSVETALQAELSPNNGSLRRWVFVIDTDRCNGCMKCVEACQEEMRIPPSSCIEQKLVNK